jgi:hypothetical protein
MNNERMLKALCPLAVGYLVAFVLAFFVLSRDTPDQNAPAARVVAFYRDHGTRETAAVWIVGIGLALLTFYISGLRTALRRAYPEHSWLGTAAFAGGMVFVTGFAVIGINHYALVQAAHNNRVTLAGDLNFIDNILPLPVMLGLGVMSLAVGVAILSGSVLPKWLGVIGVLMAACTVAGPIGFFAWLALPVYFVIIGWIIPGRLEPHEHAGTEPGERAGQPRMRMRHLVPRSHH